MTWRVSKDGETFHEIDEDFDESTGTDRSLEAAKAKGYKAYQQVTKDGKDIFDIEASEESLKAAYDKGYKDVQMHKFQNDGESNVAMAGARSYAQGATFGLADEATGVAGALLDPAGFEGDFSDRYSKYRDSARKQDDVDSEQHPGVTTSMGLAGAVMSPIKGGTLTRAATQGGVAGFGHSRADNAVDLAMDTGIGAGIGFTAQYGLDKVGRGVSKATNWAKGKLNPDKLREQAGEKAVEALNPTLSQQERLANTKDISALGNRLIDEDVITPLATPKSMFDRLDKQSAEAGKVIGAQLKEIDSFADEALKPLQTKYEKILKSYEKLSDKTGMEEAIAPLRRGMDELTAAMRVDPKRIAARVQSEIVDKYDDVLAYEDALQVIRKEVDKLNGVSKSWSLADANKQKSAYDKGLKFGYDQPLAKELTKDLRRIVNSEIEDTVQLVGGMRSGGGREDLLTLVRRLSDEAEQAVASKDLGAAKKLTKSLDDFKDAKRRYGDLETAEAIAQKSAARDAKNNDFGITSYIMGGGAGATAGSAFGPIGAMIGAAGGVASRELGRRYGNQTMAVGLRKLADAIDNPGAIRKAFGKYAEPLLNSSLRGKAPLAVTHQLMYGKDAKYRELFDEFEIAKEGKKKANDWLGENIAEPLGAAGYPNTGAMLATIPSALMEVLVPSSPADYAPLGAAVHLGGPLRKLLTKETGPKLRESFDLVGNITGKPSIAAHKFPGEAPELDRWVLLDFKDETPEFVGEVVVDWSKGSPVSEFVRNAGPDAPAYAKGAINDFMEKFTERTGELTSSMMFGNTADGGMDIFNMGGRKLGQELWEDKLPRVVQGPDEPYTMLSKDRFVEWMKEQAQQHKKAK